MTNKEAIKFLKEPRMWEWLNVAQQIAIDMAIDALSQEPCGDTISRAETVQFLINHSNDFEDAKIRMAFQAASSLVNNPHNLPPALPKIKTGHWILIDNLFHKYKCSNCRDVIWTDENHSPYMDSPYCCKCGYKMIEPQESEDK